MTPADLRERTREFALAVVRAVRPVLGEPVTGHAATQLMRAAMSVAANYRSTGLSRSRAEFVSRLSIVLEEADETVHWLEMLRDIDPPNAARWCLLLDEAAHLVRIFAASKRTVTSRPTSEPPPPPGRPQSHDDR
jgi:four helix bundle protein